MVYCGKPSKGCSNCRERKIRCDQKDPTCGQCEKRQQQCPGYRNMVDLMFRDESNHVIKKATTTPKSRSSNSSGIPKSNGNSKPPSQARRPKSNGLTPPLLSPLEVSPAASPSGSGGYPDPGSGSANYGPGYADTNYITGGGSAQGTGSGMPQSLFAVLDLTSNSNASADDAGSDDAPEYGYRKLASHTEERRRRLQRHHQHHYHHHQLRHQQRRNSDSSSSTTSVLPQVCIPLSYQERGTAFFFARYVASDSGCYQNYDFIYDVWKPPISPEPVFPNDDDETESGMANLTDCVTASMIAVGLAGLSKVTRCRETMNRARQSYGIALQLANAALRDADEAVKDTTMLSVLILGTYEFISGRTPQTMRAWQEHVNGAAALASMRGTAQFASKAGANMFLMLCHSVLISCIQSDLPMPKAMIELRQELGRLNGSRDKPSWRVIDTIYRALQTRHDIKKGVITDKNEILSELHGVEDDFAAVVRELPRNWGYRRAHLARATHGIMGRWCHIYSDLAQASTWNGMRTMRILVQETIIEQLYAGSEDLHALPSHHQLSLVRAMSLSAMLGDAVIASVPQHFGLVSSRDNLSDGEVPCSVATERHPYRLIARPATQARSPSPCGPAKSPSMSSGPTLLDPVRPKGGMEDDAERFMTLATASNTIIWPLYTLGMSTACSRESKEWVIDRLEAIYEETGLEQAQVVSDMLREKLESPLWEAVLARNGPQEMADDELPMMV